MEMLIAKLPFLELEALTLKNVNNKFYLLNKRIEEIADIADPALFQAIDEKGQANGYAPLNSSSKIDSTYLPSNVGSVTVTTYTSSPITIAAGNCVFKIVIVPSALAAAVKLGSTNGGDEIMEETTITTAGLPVSVDIFSATASKSIYFAGLAAGSKVHVCTLAIPLT